MGADFQLIQKYVIYKYQRNIKKIKISYKKYNINK